MKNDKGEVSCRKVKMVKAQVELVGLDFGNNFFSRRNQIWRDNIEKTTIGSEKGKEN